MQKKIILLDFNPFGDMTDGLMFEWSELNEMSSGEPVENSEAAVISAAVSAVSTGLLNRVRRHFICFTEVGEFGVNR